MKNFKHQSLESLFISCENLSQEYFADLTSDEIEAFVYALDATHEPEELDAISQSTLIDLLSDYSSKLWAKDL